MDKDSRSGKLDVFAKSQNRCIFEQSNKFCQMQYSLIKSKRYRIRAHVA